MSDVERKNAPINMRMADVLKSVFSGEKVQARIDDWQVDSRYIESGVSFDYGATKGPLTSLAHYAFDISTSQEGVIILNNVHKRAQPGNGTISLIVLEDVLRLIASDLKTDIRLVFSVLGNPDTDKWLAKNGYTHDTQSNLFSRKYQKDIQGVTK